MTLPQCHRKDEPAPSKSSAVYAVNDIKFHPYGTFSTAGSDGTINFWDKESKTRLKSESSCCTIDGTEPNPYSFAGNLVVDKRSGPPPRRAQLSRTRAARSRRPRSITRVGSLRMLSRTTGPAVT